MQKRSESKEYETSIAGELKKKLSAEECEHVMQQSNKAAQILVAQFRDSNALQAQDLICRFQQVDLQNIVAALYDHQGGSERIKNCPYLRQYATLNLFYIHIFTFLLPFGMTREFQNLLGETFV